MIARFLLPLLSFAVLGAFGQIGVYGPVTAHFKAGDIAPDITFVETLNAPASASSSQPNLSGQLTVLAFFPDTSHNLQSVALWNAVVEKFAGKPVQFAWITGENKSTLLPWLAQHPIQGWVFYDPKGRTGNAYGMELPANVIVGADGRIVGFYDGVLETRDLLEAVQDGRLTTTRPDKATLKGFIESRLVLIDAEPRKMPRPDEHKPHFPPSYTLHISPSQGEERGNFGADDFWALQGYTLKDAIDALYDLNPIRVDLPASLDNNRHYDFALVLPEPEGREKMKDRARQGLQDYFHITARRENRLVDVYVVTVEQNRKPPAIKPRTDEGIGGSFGSFSIGFETAGALDAAMEGMKPLTIGAIRSVSIDGTADEFCHTLEAQLDRPVVNETNLEGEYNFRAESREGLGSDFLERLRDRLGLVITAAQRQIETLVFEPR
jgi:uncharacterized protein (TIGR03435 family)